MTFARTYPVWRKFAVDSPLGEAVRSELVSEGPIPGTPTEFRSESTISIKALQPNSLCHGTGN